VAKGDWSPPLPHRPAASLAGFRSAFVTSRRPHRLAHSSSWTQASLGRTWRTSPRSLAVSTSWPRGTLACAGTRLEADPDKPSGRLMHISNGGTAEPTLWLNVVVLMVVWRLPW